MPRAPLFLAILALALAGCQASGPDQPIAMGMKAPAGGAPALAAVTAAPSLPAGMRYAKAEYDTLPDFKAMAATTQLGQWQYAWASRKASPAAAMDAALERCEENRQGSGVAVPCRVVFLGLTDVDGLGRAELDAAAKAYASSNLGVGTVER